VTRWYVVHTKPGGELAAEGNLRRQGYTVYLPRYLKRRRHARKVEAIKMPLFPRYLFVQLDLEHDRWRPILSTYGVSDLVTFGRGPAAVPDGVVEAIKRREHDDGLVRVSLDESLRPGEPVRITSGALLDRLGLFQGRTDKDRVVVLLDLLGRRLRVTLSDESVIACAG